MSKVAPSRGCDGGRRHGFSDGWLRRRIDGRRRRGNNSTTMQNLKPFHPNEIDETTSRVVTHGGGTHLLFPYINAVGATPKFESVSCVIKGPAATVDDFAALSALAAKAGENARWAIAFNTPWLVPIGGTDGDRPHRSHDRART
jgi:hypothetical protein